MPLDADRDGERFFVTIDLPGVDPASIDVSVEKNVLTVSAGRRIVRDEGQEWVVAEPRKVQISVGDGPVTPEISAA